MFVIALAYLAFVSIALPDSMLGVAWPSMRVSFVQPTSAAGLVPPFGVAAGLISTSLSSSVVARVGVGRLLAGGTFLSALALGVSAASATFWQFLVSVVLSGLSAGAVDATLNAYAARTFGPRRINLLHASYGVGAAVSPLIVTAVIASGASWRWSFVIVGSLQLAVAVVFTATRRRWPTGPPTPAHPGHRAHPGHVRRKPIDDRRVWTVGSVLGMLAVAVQTGIESAVALWAYTFLTGALGVSAVVAGSLASGYWLTMIAGRVALGSLAERLGSWPVMAIAVAGLLLAALLVNLPAPLPAMLAVLLFGLATAPMYPLLVLTTAERTSPAVADRVVGFQAAASSLGAAVIPPLVGLAMGRSVSSFGPALAALCLLAVGLQVAMRSRRAASGTMAP